jgi:hypothetical protein
LSPVAAFANSHAEVVVVHAKATDGAFDADLANARSILVLGRAAEVDVRSS